MTQPDTELIRRLISGDAAATAGIVDRARASDEPGVLVAAALVDPAAPDLLARAAELAASTRDRQLVAIAAAHLAGDSDRVDALARDHLVDHPDNLLVAWIAGGAAPLLEPHQPTPPHHERKIMNRRLTAALLVAAAVLTNVAFTALGTVFNYPDVLNEPVEDVLAAFSASQAAVSAWFGVLAVSAALFAPIAVGVGRLSARPAMRLAVPVGIAAAVVQAVGLLRWPLLVPGFAADAASADPATVAAAHDSFLTAHRILGTIVGETFGYVLTAAWTVLVLAALGRSIAGRWFTALGAVSAVLILAGVLSPLQLPVIDLANFAGYILWSAWLVAFAVLILRRAGTGTSTSTEPALAGARS
jgi:hypothetical protein